MATYSTDSFGNAVYNGASLTDIVFNNVKVWSKLTSVSISGSLTVGSTLTAVLASGDGTPIGYQWYRGNSLISGATSRTYTTSSADAGYTLKCIVTAYGGRQVTGTASGIIKTAITGVSISGTARVGSTLTANVTPSGATVSYSWTRGGTVVSTSSSYTCTSSDAGYALILTVTGTGNYYNSASATSSRVERLLFSIAGTSLSQWTSAGFALATSRAPSISNGYTLFQSAYTESDAGVCAYRRSNNETFNTFTFEFTAYTTNSGLGNALTVLDKDSRRYGAGYKSAANASSICNIAVTANASSPLVARIVYDGTNVRVYNNGTLIGTVAASSLPSTSTPNRFEFGCVNGWDACNLYVKNVNFYYS